MALDTVLSNWNAEHRCGDEREALLSRPRQALGTIEEKDWRMLEISAMVPIGLGPGRSREFLYTNETVS